LDIFAHSTVSASEYTRVAAGWEKKMLAWKQINLTLGGGVCLSNSTISNGPYAILFFFFQDTHKGCGS